MKKIMVASTALLLGLASVSMAQATNGNPNGVSTQAGSTGSSTQGGIGTMQQDRSSKSAQQMPADHTNHSSTTATSGSSMNSGTGKTSKSSGKMKKAATSKKTATSTTNN